MTTPTSIRGFGGWGDQGRGRALSAGRADPGLYRNSNFNNLRWINGEANEGCAAAPESCPSVRWPDVRQVAAVLASEHKPLRCALDKRSDCTGAHAGCSDWSRLTSECFLISRHEFWRPGQPRQGHLLESRATEIETRLTVAIYIAIHKLGRPTH